MVPSGRLHHQQVHHPLHTNAGASCKQADCSASPCQGAAAELLQAETLTWPVSAEDESSQADARPAAAARGRVTDADEESDAAEAADAAEGPTTAPRPLALLVQDDGALRHRSR